jgi:hypothetical protein
VSKLARELGGPQPTRTVLPSATAYAVPEPFDSGPVIIFTIDAAFMSVWIGVNI